MTDITRRKFIKGSVAGVAGCTLLYGLNGCRVFSGGKNSDLKIIHITDSHFDLKNENSIKILEAFVNKVNSDIPDVDLVLFGGDNFNNNAPGKEDAKKFKEIVSKLYCPWYAVRGNKESSPKPAGTPLNQKDFAEMFFPKDLKVKGRDWKLKKGKYLILGVDTTIKNQGNGFFTEKSLDFVENELKSNKDAYCIVLNHQVYHNFWNGTEKKDLHKYVLNNTKEVQKRLFGHKNLIMTLSGHKHLDNVKKIQGVDVISTVGFIVPQKNRDDHQFRIIELKDGKVVKQSRSSII